MTAQQHTATDTNRAFANLWSQVEQAPAAERRLVFLSGLSRIAPRMDPETVRTKATAIGEHLQLVDESFSRDVDAAIEAPAPAARQEAEPPSPSIDSGENEQSAQVEFEPEELTAEQIILRRKIPNALAAAAGNPVAMLQALKAGAAELAMPIRHGSLAYHDAEEALLEMASARGLMDDLTPATVEIAVHAALTTFEVEAETPAEQPPPPEWPDRFDDQPVTASPVTIDFTNAADWPDAAPAPVAWVVKDRIPRGDVATLDGDGGLGKTMLALQLAVAVSRGAQDWAGSVVDEQGDVLFLSAEEPEAEIHRRAYRIAARGGFSMAELGNLHLWFPSDVGDTMLAIQTGNGVLQATPLFRAIADRIVAMRPALVVLDNVAAIYGGNQNDRGQVRTFMNLWRGVARASGAAILLLNHPSLSGLTAGTGRGGSMDWRNAVRAALHLKPAEDKADADRGVRVLECVKNNYAAHGPAQRLEWIDGVLTPEGTASPFQRAAQESQADEKFMALLDMHTGLGINVSVDGPKYAPKVFADHPDSGGYRKQAFAAALHRLLTAGRVVVETHGSESKQRKRIVRAK